MRSTTPSFVATRRIDVTYQDSKYLDQKFYICNRIYNAGVTHYKMVVDEILHDEWFQHALSEYRKTNDEKLKKVWGREIDNMISAYHLTEYDIHAYMGVGKVRGYEKGIGINIVQKQGTSLYKAVNKALFSGSTIHYRKISNCKSFEDKSPKTGIIYHEEDDTLVIMGRRMKLRPVRKKDYWMQDAMTHRIKYMRVVREPFGDGYRYFAQFIMEGTPPVKHKMGKGKMGIDPGVSTMASYTGKELCFDELSPDTEPYNKKIRQLYNKFERQKNYNNLHCFNKNGTYKKGQKLIWTKGMKKTMQRIRSVYRQKRTYVKEYNNRLQNLILEHCNYLIIEEMNYKSLQRRSSKTERQTKLSVIKRKDGKIQYIHKMKRKKRFGRSILEHAPAGFIKGLKEKITRQGGYVMTLNTRKYCASQKEHVTGKKIKHELSDRTKFINKKLVQRDCYSAFLIYHALDEENIDYEACKKDFRNYLKRQKLLVNEMLIRGDKTGNFGLKDFQEIV